MFKHIKDNKGFSLIELMVVVAIIGILAAIAVPSYQGFQKKARTAEGKNALGTVYTAVRAIQAEGVSVDSSSNSLGLSGNFSHYQGVGFKTAGKNGSATYGSSGTAFVSPGDACADTIANLFTDASPKKLGALAISSDNADHLTMDKNRVIEANANADSDDACDTAVNT